MEAALYFLIKIACAIFILWHLWSFIFGQKMYEVWEQALSSDAYCPYLVMEIS